ncbi:MAG: class I SAM-dependent methyltransferase [Nitrospirae bacterium]|nr:MAG: class I SAM-dependent methyltransferase [Nitrospirota bacterium]
MPMPRVREALKRAWYVLFRERPYAYLGQVLVMLLPASYLDRVRREFFTAKGPSGILADMVRAELNRQYYIARDAGEIRRQSRELFWASEPGRRWHELSRERYRDPILHSQWFLEPRLPLVQQIKAFLTEESGYHTICEVGTGNGLFLQHLTKEFPTINRFVGIDLNREQIVENQHTYADFSMEFVHGEVLEWVQQSGRSGTIFVASETFEFIRPQELTELFQCIRKQLGRVAIGIFAAVEPGWAEQTISRPRGSTAYSHNFPYLLEQCHYRIFRQDVRRAGPYDRIYLLAVALPATDA